ncbi:MAG: hypothetical protein ACI9IA_000947 [Enterobacterales bacterium]|jgi:hypothetical protein
MSYLRPLIQILALTISFINFLYVQHTLKITLVEDPWPPYVTGKLGAEADGGVVIDLYKELFKRIEDVEVTYQ